MWDSLVDHWNFNLAARHSPSHITTMVLAAACVMYFSVVVLHAFIPSPQPVADVLLHALGVAVTYTIAISLGLVALAVWKPGYLRVWQIWLFSFVIYVGGFWLSQWGDAATANVKYALHPDLGDGDALFHFLRLIPIWLVLTYLFIAQLLKRELQQELEHLALINQQLAHQSAQDDGNTTIDIESGKQVVTLRAEQISCISVDDHYCSIFVEEAQGCKRHDVSQSLKAIETALPPQFMRVHRSHIVNLDRVVTVRREERNLRLVVGPSALEIPVSRSRAGPVLKALEGR